MSSSRVLVVLLIGLSLVSAPAVVGAAYFISVDASPVSIPADGKSYSQVLVTVVDEKGSPAPDNTEVRLTASAGDVTPSVRTSGGRAVGILTSSTSPQIAVITAFVGGASASTQVGFSESGIEEGGASARTIRMKGGTLAYCVDEDTVVGSDKVTIEYRELTIRANSAQVRQSSGQIRAQGDVTLTGKEDRTLSADELTFDVRTDRLMVRSLNDESSVRTYSASRLETVEVQNAALSTRDFSPLMDVDGRTWIISDRLVLIPGQKILFYKASVYVGDVKVLSMPYYAYNYEKRESILQQVRYTSYDGMVMDLPYYYHLGNSAVGSLKFRYSANGTDMGTYYRPRKGTSVGLEEDYWLGDRSQGRLFIDSLGSPSQAYEMLHRVEFGTPLSGGRADISARYQPSSDYARDIYYTSMNMMGGLGKYSYSVSGYLGGSRYQQYDPLNPETTKYTDQSTSSVRTIFRPRLPILSKQFGSLSPSLTLGYGTLWSSSGDVPSSQLYQSLGLSFNRTLSNKGNISTSLDGSAAFTSTAKGGTGTNMYLRPGLNYNWANGSVSLNYTLNLQDGVTDGATSLSKHQLGCSLNVYSGGKWSSNVYADYGLDSKQLNLVSSLRYRLDKRWQIKSNYNLYRYAYELNGSSYDFETSYLTVGLYRPLGPYEIGLVWSPDGRNYGIDQGKRIWLELGGRGF